MSLHVYLLHSEQYSQININVGPMLPLQMSQGISWYSWSVLSENGFKKYITFINVSQWLICELVHVKTQNVVD
jgi:hypothetical protein